MDVPGDSDGWDRVSALLDQMTSERERLNREHLARGETEALLYVPSTREFREALLSRDGRGMSYRDIGPSLTRYVRENDVLRRLKPRPGQRFEPAVSTELHTDLLPMRVRHGVDAVFGRMERHRDELGRLLLEEVAIETEALRRRISALEAETAELLRLLADREDLIEDADQARAEQTAAVAALEQERRLRKEANVQAELARNAARAAEQVRDRAYSEAKAADDMRAAAETKLHAMVAAVQKLSEELERAGREREEDRRRIVDLMARYAISSG